MCSRQRTSRWTSLNLPLLPKVCRPWLTGIDLTKNYFNFTDGPCQLTHQHETDFVVYIRFLFTSKSNLVQIFCKINNKEGQILGSICNYKFLKYRSQFHCSQNGYVKTWSLLNSSNLILLLVLKIVLIQSKLALFRDSDRFVKLGQFRFQLGFKISSSLSIKFYYCCYQTKPKQWLNVFFLLHCRYDSADEQDSSNMVVWFFV